MTANTSQESKRNRQFIAAGIVSNRQRLHFVIWTIAPLLLCAIWFVLDPAVTAIDVAFLLGMWSLTGGLGISLGYHRYYTHGAFQAHPILQAAMAITGSFAAQGPVTYWVSVHRCHHQHSDDEFDPHSPRPPQGKKSAFQSVLAFLHGHMGWVLRHDVPSPVVFARDLGKNPIVRFFDKTYWSWAFLGIVLPGIFMLAVEPSWHGFLRGCIFGGLLRILIGNQIIWAINSVCHAAGSHPHDTHDHSTNNWLLAIPAFGEGWHNNHHAFPWSAKFGQKWWQLDLGWMALRCFEFLGLASNIKRPSADQINLQITTRLGPCTLSPESSSKK